MPITLDGVTNILSVTHVAGDPKGDAGNPYVYNDITVAIATFTRQGDQFYCPHRLHIDGVNTWLVDSGKSLHADAVDGINYTIRFNANVELVNCHLKDTGGTERQDFRGYYKLTNCLINLAWIEWRQPVIGYSEAIQCVIRGGRTARVQSERVRFTDCIFNRIWYIDVTGDNRGEFINCVVDSPTQGGFEFTGAYHGVWRNLDFRNSPVDFRGNIRMNAGRVFNLINCLIGGTYSLIGSTGSPGDQTINSQTEFMVLCQQDGAVARLYDNADNLIYDQIVAGGETPLTALTWFRLYILNDGADATVDVTPTDLEPFRLEVSQAGFQTDITENIYMTEEVSPGVRRGTLYPKVMDVTLVRPTLQITAIDITDVTRIGATDGQLVVTATGGDSTYEYSIDNVNWQVSNTFTGLAAGTYTVYVRDGQTPAFTDSFEVEVNEPVLQPIFREMSFSVAPQTISASVVQRVSVKVTCKN